jgi:hypothetical protein
VLIVAITQAAIRGGRAQVRIEHRMTVADLRAAMTAVCEVEEALIATPRPEAVPDPDRPHKGDGA